MTMPGESGRVAGGGPHPQAGAVYKFVYDEALRLLDHQREELMTIRTRTVQYLAFIGTASAFLAGTGLKGHSRGVEFYVFAGLGSFLFIVTLLFGTQTLSGYMRCPVDEHAAGLARWRIPKLMFEFSPAGVSQVIDKPIEVGAPGKYYSEAAILKQLALQAEAYHDRNQAAAACCRGRTYCVSLWGSSSCWRGVLSPG